MKKNFLAFAALSYALGIFWRFYFQTINVSYLLVALVGYLLIGIFVRSHLVKSISVLLCIFVLGAIRIDMGSHLHPNQLNAPKVVTVTKILRPNKNYNRYYGKLSHPFKENILLWIPKQNEKPSLNTGDRLSFYSKIDSLNFPESLDFSYSLYLNKLGIYHRAVIRKYENLPSKKNLFSWVENLRQKQINIIDKIDFDREEKTLFFALTLGHKDSNYSELQLEYAQIGVSHILAISGLHIGILFGLIYLLFWPLSLLPKGKIIRLITALLILWFLSVFVGFGPSVVRATTLTSFLSLGLVLHRPNPPIHYLLLSGFVTLVVRPFELFSVGFQLSYAAVTAIILGYPLLKKWIEKGSKALKPIRSLIAISILAQLGVLPLSIYYFGSFSGLFLLGNILLIPLMGLELSLYYSLLLGLHFAQELPLLVAISKLGLSFTNQSVHLLQKIHLLRWENLHIESPTLLLCYLFYVVLYRFLSVPSYLRLRQLFVFLLMSQIYSAYNLYKYRNREILLLINEPNNTLIGYLKGQQLIVYYQNQPDSKTLKVIENTYHIKQSQLLQWGDGIELHRRYLKIIDCSGFTTTSNRFITWLYIDGNPKINLERFLKNQHIKGIFISSTNSKWNADRWIETAKKEKLPYIELSRMGVFKISNNGYESAISPSSAP